MAHNLRWTIYENPIVSNAVFLNADDHFAELGAAQISTLATAGYGPALLAFKDVPKSVIRDALNSTWLLKRVVASDGAGGATKPWEGYIAEIRGTVDHVTREVRVNNLKTKTRVRYVEPGMEGTVHVSVAVNSDVYSTGKYGILEELIDLTSHGTIDTAQANQKGITYLNERTTPKGGKWKAGKDDPPERSLELSLWGYGSTLGFQYTTLQLRTKTLIQTIVANLLQGGNVQFVDTTDLSGLGGTGVLIKYNTSGGPRRVDDFLKDVIGYGNSQYRRLFLQVWEDRKIFLQARPTTIGYYARSDSDVIWGKGHEAIVPWRLRAGDYLFEEDFPGALTVPSDIDADARAVLVEATSYDDLTGAWDAEPADVGGVELLLGKVVGRVRVIS